MYYNPRRIYTSKTRSHESTSRRFKSYSIRATRIQFQVRVPATSCDAALTALPPSQGEIEIRAANCQHAIPMHESGVRIILAYELLLALPDMLLINDIFQLLAMCCASGASLRCGKSWKECCESLIRRYAYGYITFQIFLCRGAQCAII